MKTKTQKMLPKTTAEIQNGGVYSQRVRCGKANCKCACGETHIAYYFFTRRDGKLTKTYVRKAELKEFSRLVRQASGERKYRRQNTRTDSDVLKQLRQALSEHAALINLLKGKEIR